MIFRYSMNQPIISYNELKVNGFVFFKCANLI